MHSVFLHFVLCHPIVWSHALGYKCEHMANCLPLHLSPMLDRVVNYDSSSQRNQRRWCLYLDRRVFHRGNRVSTSLMESCQNYYSISPIGWQVFQTINPQCLFLLCERCIHRFCVGSLRKKNYQYFVLISSKVIKTRNTEI